MKKRVFTAGLALIPVMSIAGVHKCNIDGDIVYQQNTCPDEQQSMAIHPIKQAKATNRAAVTHDEYNRIMQRYAGTYIPSPNPYVELERMNTVSLKASNKAKACEQERLNTNYGKKCLDFFAYSNGKPENTPANGMVLFLRMTQQNPKFTEKNKAKVNKILARFDEVVNLKKSVWHEAGLRKALRNTPTQ